jgi:hypothetical protein
VIKTRHYQVLVSVSLSISTVSIFNFHTSFSHPVNTHFTGTLFCVHSFPVSVRRSMRRETWMGRVSLWQASTMCLITYFLSYLFFQTTPNERYIAIPILWNRELRCRRVTELSQNSYGQNKAEIYDSVIQILIDRLLYVWHNLGDKGPSLISFHCYWFSALVGTS